MDYFDNEKIKDYGNTPIVTELNYLTLKNKKIYLKNKQQKIQLVQKEL